VLSTDGHLVPEPEAVQLLGRYQIPYPDHALAHNAEEAAEIADRLGYPLVLKVVSPDVIHKSDLGAVVIGLESRQAVQDGYRHILVQVHSQVPQADIHGVLVCRQAAAGLEVIVGALDDSVFGPTVMFGLGGIFAEVFRDVTFRIAPLSRADAQEMIQEVRGYPLIAGVRGQPACDEQALVDLVLAVSQVVTDHPEIKELDLNPVRLYGQGLLVLDARIITTGEC
jgi:acyl-CoA synthetase (NDP forming)